MTEISKLDITMSMLEREAANIVNMAASKFGYQGHPLINVVLNYAKQAFGPGIKAELAKALESGAASDDVIDAGSEALKDTVSGYLDNFSTRIKTKLNESGGQNGRNTSEE